jgi:hypothetical protein
MSSCYRNIKSNVAQEQNLVEKALIVELSPTSIEHQEKGAETYKRVIDEVYKADYKEALNVLLNELRKYPANFTIQLYLAAILGDYSELIDEPQKSKMIKKSKDIFSKLMNEVSSQPKNIAYKFKNEYYFRLGQHKEQYQNGVTMINDYWDTSEYSTRIGASAYYNQGVGAAYFAKQLLQAGNRQQALDYAQKSVVAWGQYFSLENDYYNPYVHYGLALGILGQKDEMMRALRRGAELIKRDLNYTEFKDVIDFINTSN